MNILFSSIFYHDISQESCWENGWILSTITLILYFCSLKNSFPIKTNHSDKNKDKICYSLLMAQNQGYQPYREGDSGKEKKKIRCVLIQNLY